MELSCAIRFIMRPSSDYDSIAERGTGMESVIKKAPRAGWADAGSDERRQSFGGALPACHRQPIRQYQSLTEPPSNTGEYGYSSQRRQRIPHAVSTLSSAVMFLQVDQVPILVSGLRQKACVDASACQLDQMWASFGIIRRSVTGSTVP
jgi:hypothetical protein